MKCRIFLAAGLVLALFSGQAGAETLTGNWAMSPAQQAGKVQFLIVQARSTSSSDWDVSQFGGVDLTSPKHEIHFALDRDAGRVEADGIASDGAAAGTFRFTPNTHFAETMGKLGLGSVDDADLFSYAVQDVSLAFAHEMAGAGIGGLTAGKLWAFRIHHVDLAFVTEIRRAGARADTADTLVNFAIHRVTPDFVRSFKSVGVAPDDQQLITLAIHGANPDWTTQIARLGYTHMTAEQLVNFRIHGVTPDYIAGVRAQGLKDATADQLVQMRIHGIN